MKMKNNVQNKKLLTNHIHSIKSLIYMAKKVRNLRKQNKKYTMYYQQQYNLRREYAYLSIQVQQFKSKTRN